LSATLVVPTLIADQLRSVADLEAESGGVILASPVALDDGSMRLLAHTLVLVPDDAYTRRDWNGLEVTSAGFVPPLRKAEELGAVPIWMHTHPGHGSSVRPSPHDDIVDSKLRDLFTLRSGGDFYGALIVSLDDSGRELRFSAHIDDVHGQARVIDRMLIVGPRISLIETGTPQPDWQTSAAFDRNVRAFGGAVQRMLAHLNVAIVGCGGTGSSVAEQLVRLGVRRLTLLDPEDVSETNITRLYGSTAADIGTPKVKVLENYLSRIAPELQVDAVQGMVTRESLARRMSAADVIFGCTDDNAGRLVLSRLSTYLMVPVIDGGVLLSSGRDGTLSGIDGRVTLMYPGAACLVCRGRVDLQRAASESLTPDERVRRVDEGYAPGLGGAEPAVVAFTTAVAAAAVSELLNALIGYGPEPHPTEILLRLHDREVSTNVAKPQSGHYCDPSSGKIGRGVTVPFLEKTWPS